MRLLLILLFTVTFLGCSKVNKEYTEYNQFGGYTRDNNYSYLGNFNFSVNTKTKISINDFSGVINLPLFTDVDEFVAATSNGKINKIKGEKIVWSYECENKSNSITGIVADIKKNYFFVTLEGFLYSISNSGKLNWRFNLNIDNSNLFISGEPLIVKNNIFIGTNSGYLFKFNTDGKLLFKNKYNASINSIFSSNGKDKIYLGLSTQLFDSTDKLLIINFSGKEIKSRSLNNFRILSPIIYNQDKIFVSGSFKTPSGISSAIKCFDENYKEIWEKEVPLIINQLSHDGQRLYAAGFSSGIGENISGIFSYDDKGVEVWKNYFDFKIASPLLLCKKFLVFSGSDENGAGISILNKNSGDLADDFSFADETPLFLIPVISDNRDINLFGSQVLFQIKLTQTPLDKLLPY